MVFLGSDATLPKAGTVTRKRVLTLKIRIPRGSAVTPTNGVKEPPSPITTGNKKRRSAVITGSVIVPGVPNPHRLVMQQCRHSFDMGSLAKEAMSIPPQTKLATILVTTRKYLHSMEKRSVCYLSVSIRIGDRLKPWCPPPDVTILSGGIVGSFVEKDTRWFLNKTDATRYTLLCAALVGNKTYTLNVLVPRYLATAIGEDTVVLFDPLRNRHGARRGEKVLFGAITCVGSKLAIFHLVDDRGKTYSPDGGLQIGL
jgi:hypothetical protein